MNQIQGTHIGEQHPIDHFNATMRAAKLDKLPSSVLGEQQRSALDTQVGGEHYKGRAIQPVEYISANNLNFLEGCIVKRITRWREKNGFEDLQKIKHEVDLLIEMEKKYHAGAVAQQGHGRNS